jgi:hypothetical protein
VTTREGVRVTTPERTIADVAESGLAPDQTVMAIRQAIDRGLTTPARIRTAVSDRGRRVRDLIETGLSGTAS